MFWVFFMILITTLCVVQLRKIKELENESIINGKMQCKSEEKCVVVVDKNIEITTLKENNYLIYVQLDNLKIIELEVDSNVFNDAVAGDFGVIEESIGGGVEFKMVS